jgi:hypothetical protein
MEASRRQPGMLEGLSRFLIQHERCGAGFDVAHPAGLGSGRVSITCRGCGARHEYATATIEFERELKIETTKPPRHPPPPPRRPPSAIPPRPAPYPDSLQPPPTPTPPAEPPPEPTPAPRSTAAARPATTHSASAAAAAAARPAPRVTGAAGGGAASGPAVGRPGITVAKRRPGAVRAWQRFWASPRATTTLFVIAAVALGFGVVRLVNGGGSSNNTTAQQAPALTAPTTAPTPAAPAPGEPNAAQPTPAQPPSTASVNPPSTTLRTSHFTIEAPRGWTERTSSGGLLLRPGNGGRVNLQVYFQRSPGLSASVMSEQTATFLRNAIPGASIFRRKIRVAGTSAYELTARGPGETAIAVDVLRGPYRYLLVRRIFAGAKPHTSQAASQAVLSFRPR